MSDHREIEKLLSFYAIAAYQDMEIKDLFESEGEEDSSEDEEDEMVMLGLASLLGTRYLEQRDFHVAKSKHWYYHILPKYDDSRFKIIMRMDPVNFQNLLSKLITYPVFQNNSNHSQAPVEFQLAIFLRRIGSKKNIFEWPTGEAKHNTHEGFKNIGGMENIIGAIDGSHIGLANAPLRQPETYWNRKKRYSIQLQGIVDYRELNNDNMEGLYEDSDSDDDDNDYDEEIITSRDEIALRREGKEKEIN
ncbi:hypothetical protein RhiirA4_472402 [Rhizophagus irregularis]|uniref:DDE Tnp4 domain-containing protein n=1 Tax=Rhizophagus irregularis TaxID=588596 RepID=A0A2I1H4W0_9GLOM|nr:hypothetical protein RhiirA4_472402 [Rhizophagus irregularis]